ncbi:MAG: vitamin K epoxide reductase family protein [bacterium]|nr:vitamin K epoxide reductase family protein [bacterium]
MTAILLFTLSLFGFGVSFYIFFKKKRGEKLVCLIGEDCNKVVNSSYNSMFGFPNEILGMGYYALVAFGAMLLQSGVSMIGPFPLRLLSLATSGTAALFSLYLIYIQAFVLKEWCEYCVATALTSCAIFAILALS